MTMTDRIQRARRALIRALDAIELEDDDEYAAWPVLQKELAHVRHHVSKVVTEASKHAHPVGILTCGVCGYLIEWKRDGSGPPDCPECKDRLRPD